MHARLLPETWSSRLRAVLLLTFAVSVGLGLAGRPAHADRLTKTIDKMVQLNKKGMDDLDIAEFESARKSFFAAEEMGRKAGLGDHPVMARTYVHLGALALLGYKDKPKATEYFVRAFAMQPDIELDKSLRLGAVGALFNKVQAQKPAPGGAAAKAPPPALPPPDTKARARKGDDGDDGEAAAPSAPPKPVVALNCANPDSTPPDQDLTLRCAPTTSEDVVAVSLLYKGEEMKNFESISMEKSNKGWFQGTVPSKRVQGAAIKFYFEGVDQEGTLVGASGTAAKPHVMAIAEPQKVVVPQKPAKKKAVGSSGRASGDGGEGEGDSSLGSSSETSDTQYSWWLGGGVGKRGVGGRTSAHKTIGAVRLGGSASFPLAQPDLLGNEYELRWGPWLMAETQLDGFLGELGVELMAAPIKVARLAYGLRLGGGYGKDKQGGVPEISATLTIGTRSLVTDDGGGDDEEAGDDSGDDDDKPKRKRRATESGGTTTGNWANGIRGFFTFRNTPPKSGHGLTFLFGVEISPALFLPPYTKARWVGGE